MVGAGGFAKQSRLGQLSFGVLTKALLAEFCGCW